MDPLCFMHKGVRIAVENVKIELIPPCGGSQFRARKTSQRVKPYPVDHQQETIKNGSSTEQCNPIEREDVRNDDHGEVRVGQTANTSKVARHRSRPQSVSRFVGGELNRVFSLESLTSSILLTLEAQYCRNHAAHKTYWLILCHLGAL